MTKKRNKHTLLIKNWSYLLLSDISQAIVSFFVFMFLARKLSPEGFGTLNTILAIASFLSVFAINLSANQVITREVTLQPTSTKKIYLTVLPIRLISLFLTIVALIIYQYQTGDDKLAFIVASSTIVIATLLWDLAESIAFGHFVTRFTSVISISASICWLIVVFLLPSSTIEVELVVNIYAGILLIRSLFYLGLTLNRFVNPNAESSTIEWKAILVMSLPFFWMRIVGAFGEQVPILLLKNYSGVAEVGYFAVGNRFVVPITIAVSTGLRAVFPFMTKLYHEDKDKFNIKLAEGFKLVFIVGSTIAMLLTLSSGFLVPVLFGEAYQKSILAFNFQAWFGVLLCFDLLLSTVLASTYRQNVLAIIITIDVLILFPLMFFGAKYGAEGMAIAKLIGAIIAITYHVVVVTKNLKIDLYSVSFYLSVLYFIIFFLTTLFIFQMIWKLLIIVITLIIYSSFKNSPVRNLISILIDNIKVRIK